MRLFHNKLKPTKFKYIPQHYDERKERLENMLKESDPNGKDTAEATKARIKHGLTYRPYFYDKNNTAGKMRKKSNMRTFIIFVILLISAIIYLSNYTNVILDLAK